MGNTGSQKQPGSHHGRRKSVFLARPPRTPHVFLFVNASSGGSCGTDLLGANVGALSWKGGPGNKPLHAHVINIRNAADRVAGFERVRSLVQGASSDERTAGDDALDESGALLGAPPPPVYVVGCGGDGTVKWVMTELAERGLADVPIAAVPFGTGNDLSRTLGWGGGQPPPSLTGRLFSDLRDHTRLVATAQPTLFDIWEITISAAARDVGGGFFNVRDGKEVPLESEKMSELASTASPPGERATRRVGEQVHVELMMNYFSIGADAAMCFDFERNRPKGSAAMNKLVYAIEGGKQQVLAHRYPSVTSCCSRILAGPGAADVELEASVSGEGGDTVLHPAVMEPRDLKPLKQKAAKAAVFLNIPSYGGGNDIWSSGARADDGDGRTSREQCFNDGLLELVSVASTDSIAFNMLTQGKLARGIVREAQARRYDIDFEPDLSEVYVQVDGEAIKVKQPRSVHIRRLGQVVVLLNGQAQRRPGAGKSQRSRAAKAAPLSAGTGAGAEAGMDTFVEKAGGASPLTATKSAREMKHRISTTFGAGALRIASLCEMERLRHNMGVDLSGFALLRKGGGAAGDGCVGAFRVTLSLSFSYFLSLSLSLSLSHTASLPLPSLTTPHTPIFRSFDRLWLELSGRILRCFVEAPRFDGSPPIAASVVFELDAACEIARASTREQPFSFVLNGRTLSCELQSELDAWMDALGLVVEDAIDEDRPATPRTAATAASDATAPFAAPPAPPAVHAAGWTAGSGPLPSSAQSSSPPHVPAAATATADDMTARFDRTRRLSMRASLRFDGSQRFTKEQFVAHYGGTTEWDNAAQMRKAPDGGRYTRREFMDHYGGTAEWDAAPELLGTQYVI